MTQPLLQRHWKHYIIGFGMCVSLCAHPKGLRTQYLIDPLEEFNQIYNVSALRHKVQLI